MSRLPLFSFALIFSAVSMASDCTPTPTQSLGTHYEPDKAEQAPGDIGSGFILGGRILSSADCRPVAGARITHWQGGEEGRYLDRLRAWRRSDAEGRYRFETEWPDMYVPHVHFIVEAAGFETLTTQWIGNARRAEVVFDMVLRPLSD